MRDVAEPLHQVRHLEDGTGVGLAGGELTGVHVEEEGAMQACSVNTTSWMVQQDSGHESQIL